MTTEATGDTQTPAPGVETPAPAAAPAPAPVVETTLGDPAAPAATPATPEAPAPATGETVAYDPTGDVGLDIALGFVGKLGIAADHPAMQATATGDFSLIKAHLATMGDKAQGWEQMVALAEASFTRTSAAAADTKAKVSAAVVQVAGSADTWNTIKSWASANATPDEKAQINSMFDAGPVSARAAAILLKDAYSKANGTVVEPKSAVNNGASGAASATAGPLSPKQYAAEVRELHNKLGTRMETSSEYAALRRRFARG